MEWASVPLRAHEQADVDILHKSWRPDYAAGLGIACWCVGGLCLSPLKDDIGPLSLNSCHQLVATAPKFEARLAGEALWDNDLTDERFGLMACSCAVCSAFLPLSQARDGLLDLAGGLLETTDSVPPTRSNSGPPACARTWACPLKFLDDARELQPTLVVWSAGRGHVTAADGERVERAARLARDPKPTIVCVAAICKRSLWRTQA